MNVDWGQLFNTNGNDVIGLDIGTSAVKLVQLSRTASGYVVTAAGRVDVPNKTKADQDQIKGNTIDAIRKCAKSAGIKTKYAVCGVGGPEAAVRHFKFPLLSEAETEGAVLLEAEQVCPFNADDSFVDYQLIPNGDDNISGILVAATNKLVAEKKQQVEKANLKNVLMDADGLALLNCFNEFNITNKHLGDNRLEYEKANLDHITAILNVGNSLTNLAILGKDAVPFVRDIAYAGNDIVARIAADNGLSAEAVEKSLFDSDNSQQAQSELGDSITRACQKLITDVSETLRFYTAQDKSRVLETVFVCGGFALAKGFVELLDNQLPVKAVLWNPFEDITCNGNRSCKEIIKESGPAMAVAAGLALRSI